MATFGEQMRALMGTRGVSLHGLARATNYDVSYLCKVANGRVRPSLKLAEALNAALGADGELVALHAAEVERLRLERLYRRTLKVQPSAPSEDDDMERRRLMRDAAAVAAVGAVAPVLTALTDAFRVSEKPLPGATVSRSMLADWEDAYIVHHQRLLIDTPAAALAALAVDFADMAPHLARTQPDAVQRDLAHTAARHTALIAGGWFFLGNQREARRWWAKTAELATRSGDDRLASRLVRWEVNCRMADQREDLAALRRQAQWAARLAGSDPSPALIGATATEAAILAIDGRYADAVAKIRDAEDLADRCPETYEEGNFHFFRSLVFTLAGHGNRATAAQSAAEPFWAPDHYGLSQIRLHGAAVAAADDPEAGIAEAKRIIVALPEIRRNPLVMSSAKLVLRATPEHARGLDSARELRALMSA